MLEHRDGEGEDMKERCEYCQSEHPMGGKEIRTVHSAQSLVVDGDFLYVYCDCGRHTVTTIKYCPMCGRRL